jgi:hypothetical protein
MSNVDAREGRMTRVALHHCQCVGFGLTRGDVRDLRVVDSSLQLASFASATLRNVVLERVNLAEASFMHARLESVAFVDCRLEGADFRHARLAGCAIRGASLEGVLGIDSLRGLRMPWPDVLPRPGRSRWRSESTWSPTDRVPGIGRAEAALSRPKAVGERPPSRAGPASWIGASPVLLPVRADALNPRLPTSGSGRMPRALFGNGSAGTAAGYTRPPRGCSSVG